MKSDIEIAQEAKMKPIADIAAGLGLADEDVIPYGRYKAKVNHRLIHKASKQGKLILVTAISPTPAGEGKTTTSVGLADAMNAIGKKTMLCLREPSLGPVFGMKGGAAGGGYAQVVPMEDINLHFTGDIHAIGTANNLLAAMIDNSIQQGNPLNIDPRRNLLAENSDEPYADRIAKAVIQVFRRGGTVDTTRQLYALIEGALSFLPAGERKEAVKKSCQRTFQALRIDVNSEFEVLYAFLEKLPHVLKPGGRAAILTFHSGEDRLVKQAFRQQYRDGLYSDIAQEVTRPSPQECRRNPRAHSTKLRWAVRAE